MSKINNDLKPMQEERKKLDDAKKDKKEDEIPVAERDALATVTKQIAELESKKKQAIDEYAQGNQTIKQLIDLALISNNMLKGEALGSYPNLRINPDTNLRYERLADIFRAFNERPKLSAGYAARVELFSTKVLRRTRLVKERRAAVRRT